MQNSRTTAGETAPKETKWGWGIVALVGLMAATTIQGSLIITAVSVALFAVGAWRGGYMDDITSKPKSEVKTIVTAYAEEGVAA